jgi:hypothetical protein
VTAGKTSSGTHPNRNFTRKKGLRTHQYGVPIVDAFINSNATKVAAVVAIVVAAVDLGRCSRYSVQIAANKQQFRFNRKVIDRYTVVNVSTQSATKPRRRGTTQNGTQNDAEM